MIKLARIWGLCGDNGKENGNYYLGFRVFRVPLQRKAQAKVKNMQGALSSHWFQAIRSFR